MVTPAFRPGECGPRPPVWKTAPSYGMSSPPASHGRDIDTIPKRHLSGEYRPPDGLDWCIRPPALKGGVTAKFAFQASYAFQASAFLLTQDTWEVLPKDFCLSKVLQHLLFLFLGFLISRTDALQRDRVDCSGRRRNSMHPSIPLLARPDANSATVPLIQRPVEVS